MTIEEEIQRQEEQAMAYKSMGNMLSMNISTEKQFRAMECYQMSEHHRQIAEWLRELKERREIQDILLQFIVDIDLDICCEDLINNEEEQRICEEDCNNYSKDCWIRWEKMKIRESDNNDT